MSLTITPKAMQLYPDDADAVVGHDGADSVTGVVQEVYDDVVEILYFDRLSLTMETKEFHISQVEAYA